MTQKQFEQAYKEVNQEIASKDIELFKKCLRDYKQEQLEQQEKWKNVKEDAEERLRIIKLNLENLDNGNFKSIEERMDKSKKARSLSLVWNSFPMFEPITWNNNWTTGTYTVNGKTFYF